MSMKRVAGITALITAMAFVNSANDLTIVGNNNVCYAKVVRRVTRNVVIQKKPQLADNAQSTPKFDTSYTETEPNHTETCDIPDSETVRVDKTTDNKNLKKNQDLSLVTVPANGVDNRLGDTTVQIEQYMKANPQSGFSVISALTDYDQYGEYLNNNYKTYVFKTNNFNAPITEPITVNGNLIIEEGMYIALQSDSYELTVNGNLIIRGNGSIKCCMEKANATGLNTVQVKGNIIFDGNTHKMSFAEQSYGFAMPANYARSTQKLNFASSGTWYAMNGKSDDYYNLKQVSKTQTKYLTDVPKPDVLSVFDKKGNGDVNGDSVVNDADVELLRKYLTDIVGENAIDKKNADLNGDGKVTLTDLSQLKTMVEESKVKSPLIILTNEEINTKYSQYKKYLKLPRTYYAQDNDLSSLIKNNEIIINGNLILDKHLGDRRKNSEKKIDNQTCKYTINGSLIFIDKASGFNGDIIGTLYYNPSKWNVSDYNSEKDGLKKYLIDAIAYGDVYIMSNPYNKISESNSYGTEVISIRGVDTNIRNKIYYESNSYMSIFSLNSIYKKDFLTDIQTHSGQIDRAIFMWDNTLGHNYYNSDSYYKDSDNDIIQITYEKNFKSVYTRLDGVQADLIEPKYKGRIKALVALLLQDKKSDIENLPFLKIERTASYRRVFVSKSDGLDHYCISIIPIGENKWKGMFSIQGIDSMFEVSLSENYIAFKNRFEKILQNPQSLQAVNSGYSALIRSIFESGIDYWLDTFGGWDNFKCVRYSKYNANKEKYYVYPIVRCLQLINPYINHIRKGQRPYTYDLYNPKPKPDPKPKPIPDKNNNYAYTDWMDEILSWKSSNKEVEKAAELIFWNEVLVEYFKPLFDENLFEPKASLNIAINDTKWIINKMQWILGVPKNKTMILNNVRKNIKYNISLDTKNKVTITIESIQGKRVETDNVFSVTLNTIGTTEMIYTFKKDLYKSGAEKMQKTLTDLLTDTIWDTAEKLIPNDVYKTGIKAIKLIIDPPN